MTATIATSQAILKRLYPLGTPEALIMEMCPTFGAIPKATDFYGNDIQFAVTYGPTVGRSKTFSTAQANVAPAKRAAFQVNFRAEDFSLFRVDDHALKAASNSRGSLTNLLQDEGDKAFDALGQSIGRGVFGSGSGSICQVGSTSSMDLVVSPTSAIVHFEVGMKIVSDSVDGGGTVGTDVATITAVNEETGTISRSDANWTAGGEYTNNWYIFPEGDYDTGSNNLGVKGLAAWLPATAPVAGSDSFFNVDRGVHPTKLAGWRYTAALSAETTLEKMWINVGANLFHVGGRADMGIMNPLDFAQFVNELGSKVQTDRIRARGSDGAQAELGYDAIRIYTGAGTLKIMADQYCPKNRAYLLQTNTWKAHSLGPLPGWLDEDGAGNILRVGTANAYEGRIGCYWQMYCKAPWKNATINTSALTNPS